MESVSVIVPTRNEPLERFERTLRTLRNTQAIQHEIIVVDDNSDLDFAPLCARYDAKLRRMPARVGLHALIEEGVTLATKPFIFIIDAHMEFYDNQWDLEMWQTLEANPFVQTCHVSHAIGHGVAGRGSILQTPDSYDWLEPKWAKFDSGEIDVPLGACYGWRKSWFQYLRGVKGLHNYGANEAFLALKNVAAGGSNILLTSEVGHDYTKLPTTERETKWRHASILLNKATIYHLILDGVIEKPKIIEPVEKHVDVARLAPLKNDLAAILSRARLRDWLASRGFQTPQTQ